MLRSAGYRIVEREVCERGWLEVDGERDSFVVRADAIVERRGVYFVAEIKGGSKSATWRNRMTRRQLMEYAWVFPVEGVLLIDVPSKRIHTIRFVRPKTQS